MQNSKIEKNTYLNFNNIRKNIMFQQKFYKTAKSSFCIEKIIISSNSFLYSSIPLNIASILSKFSEEIPLRKKIRLQI